MGSIKLNKIKKVFGKTEVIPSLDLEINEGEFCVFVGPSGCGKSTLLRIIAGLEDVTSGHIEISGNDDFYGKGDKVGKNAFVLSHYRRFIEPNLLLMKLIKVGFKMLYFVETNGLAVYKDEDPIVMRVVCRK